MPHSAGNIPLCAPDVYLSDSHASLCAPEPSRVLSNVSSVFSYVPSVSLCVVVSQCVLLCLIVSVLSCRFRCIHQDVIVKYAKVNQGKCSICVSVSVPSHCPKVLPSAPRSPMCV